MKLLTLAAVAALSLPAATHAADVNHIAVPQQAGAPGGMSPAFSTAVVVGDTIYISGTVDGGPKPGDAPADTAKIAATRVMDNIKRSVEAAGVTMNDLVWVQIFCTDLSYYATFNEVYRSYFTGPLPARAFMGTDKLLNGSHFEVMGIAAKKTK